MRQRRSLAFQLSWQVGLAQAMAFLLVVAIVVATLIDTSFGRISDKIAAEVADAVEYRGNTLSIAVDRLPGAFLQRRDAWVVASDRTGDSVRFGQPPKDYLFALPLLTRVDAAEFATQSSSTRYASKLVERPGPKGEIQVLVGGSPQSGFLHYSQALFYAGIWVMLPIILLTALIVPWIIRSQLRGVHAAAREAAAIDMTQRGTLLTSDRMPTDVAPLVTAFNGALQRIWQATEERDRFLANAAHELRMPIAVLETRIRDLPASPARATLLVDLSRLQNLAEQLLDLQRVDRAPFGNTRPVDLIDLCQHVAENTAPLIVAAGYSFELEVPDHPVPVIADAGALERVINNLLQNAMAHAGGRGLIRLTCGTDRSVSVADAGPGIPEAQRTNVFSPFYRLSTRTSGSGLGLHLARKVVLWHGGTVTVEDSALGGACFTVRLPEHPPGSVTPTLSRIAEVSRQRRSS